MLKGNSPPDFSLKDNNGKSYSLKDINSTYIVLYFYPKDNTLGCTIEANGFNKKLGDFEKLKTTIIGISGGDESSKKEFCKKNGLDFTLLSDPDFKVSTDYGVFDITCTEDYKRISKISRTTFILHRHYLSKTKDYKIIKIFEKVKPENHAEEVYKFIYEHDSMTNC